MIIYFLVVLTSAFFIFFDIRHWNHTIKKNIFFSWCVFLILFAGLRAPGVDRDSVLYKETVFDLMNYLEWKDIFKAYGLYQMEIGYIFLNKLVFSLGGSFQMILFLMALFSLHVLSRDIYHYSKYPFLSLFLYVCMFYFLRDFTQIRFGLASVLMIHGLLRHADGYKKKGLFFIILAILFHNAAIIGLIVPVFNRMTKRYYKILLFICPLGFLFGFLNPIRIIASIVGLPEQVLRYLDTEEPAGILNSVFLWAIIAIVCFYYKDLKELYGKKIEYFYSGSVISIFIGLAFINFPIMQRLSTALFTTIIFIVPYLVNFLFREKRYLLIGLFMVIFITCIFGIYGVKMTLVDNLLQPYKVNFYKGM